LLRNFGAMHWLAEPKPAGRRLVRDGAEEAPPHHEVFPRRSRRSAKNPSRMTADGFLAQQFSVNKIPHRTGPVDPDLDYFSTGAPKGHFARQERFPAKWTRFASRKRVKITNLEPRFDSIETEKARVKGLLQTIPKAFLTGPRKVVRSGSWC
jgi:hypothetical protein